MVLPGFTRAVYRVRRSRVDASVGAGVDFPEFRFPPEESDRDGYWRRVSRGRERMRGRRVLIAGLARNIEPLAATVCRRLEKLGSLFRDYRVVLFENDSSDRTAAVLQEWSRWNPRFQLLRAQFDDPVHPPTRCVQRVARMAHYRNQYHRHIVENYSDHDEVIVVDTDLAGGWSHEGLADTFGYHPDWDVVGSYGIIYRRERWCWNKYVHYDAWAFRRWGSDAPLSSREVNPLAWQRGQPLVRLNSCFGGLAVYRMEAFRVGRYAGGDCEHVTFHRRLRECGFDRCFLNPSQIAIYGRHHRTYDPPVRYAFHLLHGCGLLPTLSIL
jgi:hypothetical protein